MKSIELVVTARNLAKLCSSDLHGTRQVPNYSVFMIFRQCWYWS